MKNEDIVFNNLAEVPELTISIKGLTNDVFFQKKNYSAIFGIDGGEDISPEISWNNAPAGTKSFVVTMYDPDAPTESGFWHWSIKDIPATVTTLFENAGDIKSDVLPDKAIAMPMDARMDRYVGAAPARGDEPHPYHIVVTALDVDVLDVSPDSTPAFMNFNMIGHELARGSKIVYAQL
ncbi:YbhB/YbcL family Raf kinase inhibitor-like protein [Leuconostoc citreum]|uniref:YbhB/YbcL family Raf kinase inhibitor-like protein n=1 Tax=Leuconostoc citreum TaxID=33964 RepID=UPI00209CEEC0|nr:YbhB/YbcL family Raf kinase inhibitor-like protein [Leuconostoc citreum]MCP1275906.1 YbhB/YbcL family Raf kinase inhibitor-like protein [Leuconostoc citreum]UVW16565.1 YbhB/YbcL family Raf kinase inhibitor-like protein [Leuconostoc citreum]